MGPYVGQRLVLATLLSFPPILLAMMVVGFLGPGDMAQAPTYLIWPSMVIALTILSINLAGDALRDLLDPRLRS